MNLRRCTVFLTAIFLFLVSGAALAAPEFGLWSPAGRIEDAPPGAHPDFNTPSLDGCPFTSNDGTTFFIASDRPGGLGGIDIWMATRDTVNDPWGAPVNVGAPVNSAANDFCPTLASDGTRFFFVSTREGGCGLGDIYQTRLRPNGAFATPQNLGCEVNSSADEASPFPIDGRRGSESVLYFSSTRAGGFDTTDSGLASGDSDLYMSERHGGDYGPPALVTGANSASADGHPNVRRDGLEMFFFSNRPGTIGMADIYAASRAATSDPWSAPVNLGPNVNSVDAETRPSLSADGVTLYFGSTRPGEGSSDIYVTSREKLGS
jgi:Tol biopolymer transport system component